MSLEKLRRGWRRFNELYDEFFFSPYRAAAKKRYREEEDLFLLLCFSDMLGIPNPVNYYTLELLPAMLERFHEWHIERGMEHSPLDGFKCC